MNDKMDWDWNDKEARQVSSVYRDDDETNAFILINPPQSTKPEKEKQQAAKPHPEEFQTVQPQPAESQATQPTHPQIIESQTIDAQEKAPQPKLREETQNNIPQPEFHPIVLPPNTQQYDNYNNYNNCNNNKSQTANRSTTFSEKDLSENKVSAIAAYLLGPIGIIIALLIARDSAYTAFHVRQALKITICSILLEIFAAILALFGMIPLVGIIFRIMLIITCAAWFGVLVIRLIAIVQVCSGEAKEPAIIGNFEFMK